MRFFKTTWVYFLVATLLPPLILVLAGAFERGYFDSWALIAFIVAALIALACCSVYYVAWQMGRKIRSG